MNQKDQATESERTVDASRVVAANLSITCFAQQQPSASSVASQSVGQDVANDAAVEAQWESMPLVEFDQRRRDEVWTVSSRLMGSIHCPTESLCFRRRLDGGVWAIESAASFFDRDPLGSQQHTLIFVHGNRTPSEEAIRRGLQTYDLTTSRRHSVVRLCAASLMSTVRRR